MKTNFTFAVPAMKAEDTVLFPGIHMDFEIEYSTEEFLALLPHLREMQTTILPFLERSKTETLQFIRDAGAAVTPAVLEAGKKIVDSMISRRGNNDCRVDRLEQLATMMAESKGDSIFGRRS